MSVTPSPIGGFAAQFFDNNGVILSGGKIYTYAAGTTTPQAVYTSASGATPHANPIILDSAGRVPGGEIWLTDGLVYKFVIETATAILIGTYDNITGINSNFVNYTVQEEVITATAGQTVFNLSTINYTPGTNSLTVYIDGVNQYVGDSYIETDSDTVTFTSGVHVGGEVKFTTAIQTTTGAVDASIVTFTGFNGQTGVVQDLADNDGSDWVGFIQSGTGAVARSAQDKMRDAVSVKDFGAVGDGVVNDTAAIQAAEDACAASGQALLFPAGTYRCNSGITKKSVNWIGEGKYDTKLAYYGSATFINATGTDPSRKLFTISDMELNGTNAGAAAIGITLGWNQRSTPLVRVHIFNFGHYGIHFNDQNWIVDFYDVEVDTCGGQTSNSSGIFKDTAIDAGTWNTISFYNLTVEACGSASSAAGGVRLLTTSANRGLYFYSPCIEGNFGTSEITVTNMADCQFHNLYMEVVSAQATNAVELYGVTGGFTGGYITGDNIVTNLIGVKIGAGGAFVSNAIEFDKITILNFASSISSLSAKIWTNQIHGDKTFADPSSSTQYFGDYSPRVSAVKNATQTITSGTFQKITFQTEVYDLCGKFASSTWTPQTIGTYQINAQISWSAAVDQDRLIISIYRRGSAYKSFIARANGIGEQSVQISAQVDTDLINDTIEIYARQDSGVSQTISAGAAETWFMGSLIGRTT